MQIASSTDQIELYLTSKGHLSHPVQTAKSMGKAIKDSYEKDVLNGNAYSKSYWLTNAKLTVATSLIGTKGIGPVAKVGKLPDAPKANVPKVTPNTNTQANKVAANLKSDVLSKMEEVKQQLRQLRTPSYELAGVNVGRITDNGTVGKNTPPSNPKPSTSFKPPQKKITGKSLDSVPSVRNGEFNNWFNSLTSEEFDRVWSDPKLRDKIKERLRHPGGMHEWLLVSRADTFKYWG